MPLRQIPLNGNSTEAIASLDQHSKYIAELVRIGKTIYMDAIPPASESLKALLADVWTTEEREFLCEKIDQMLETPDQVSVFIYFHGLISTAMVLQSIRTSVLGGKPGVRLSIVIPELPLYEMLAYLEDILDGCRFAAAPSDLNQYTMLFFWGASTSAADGSSSAADGSSASADA